MFNKYGLLIIMLISTATYCQDTGNDIKSNFSNYMDNSNLLNFKRPLLSGRISGGIDNYSNNYLMGDYTKSFFYWRSDIKLNLFNIPLGFRYNYSTSSQLINNKNFGLYFNKIAHDKLKDKVISISGKYLDAELDSLRILKQHLIKKSAYSEFKLKNLEKFNRIGNSPLSDTIESIDIEIPDHDSLNLQLNSTYKMVDFEKDSLKLLQSIIDDRSKISELDSLIEQREKEIARLKYRDEDEMYSAKKDRILDRIRVFEVGYAYPSYSKYLIRGNLLKGINMEYEDNNRFFAVSYGKIAKRFPDSQVQSPLDQFNSFFSTDYTVEKRILAAKTGIGKRYGTHFLVGGLIGKGNETSYFTSTSATSNQNIVFEADANFQIGKSGNFNMIYAKSFLSHNNLPQLDHAEYISKKTNMFEASFTYRLNKLIDKIEVNTEYSEPLFKSFGINHISTDYLIYKIKAQKRLSNKFKYDLGYKKENYNIQEDGIPVKIHSLLIGMDYKISKRLKIGSTLQPSIGNEYQANNNVISNIILSYLDINKNYYTSITASFNDFRIINDTSDYNLQNFVLGTNYTVNKVTLGGTVLHLSSNEIIRKKETIYNLDLSYQFTDSFTCLVGAKYSVNNSHGDSDGFVIKIDYSNLMFERLNIEAIYEKRVYSEMYYLNLENPQIFKYFSKVQLTYNF